MSEEQLNKLRAEGMTEDRLRNEIARIQRGIRVAVRPQDKSRFERRLAVFQAELAGREPVASQPYEIV
jgi:hypothetical protein